MEYKIFDNNGNVHFYNATDDDSVLEYMKTRFVDYIASVLSSDSIIIVRPNGYILAYINTATGSQTVKSMSDWGIA